jgi:N-acetylmuramoyl-L-alanine amidase
MKSDQQKGLKDRTIILDPGHGSFTQDGYYDAGAIGPTGLLESAVNLKIALKLKTLLEEKGAVVIITRSQEQDKQSPTLKDRIKDANASGADLFLSIHQNASINHKLKGIQSFFWNNSSAKIASLLASSISKSTGLSINKVAKRSFAVTENITSMPSLLIETACLSNPEEEKMLQSDNFLLLIAEGLTNGIEQFFNN